MENGTPLISFNHPFFSHMTHTHRPIRILVVDEDRETLHIANIFLRRQNVAVETAPSDKSAYRHLLNGFFDVVLTSLECETFDAEAFIHNVRDVWPSQKWLVMSSDPKGPNARRVAKDLGISPVLAKPLSVGKLGKAIQKACNLPAKGGDDTLPFHERDLGGELTTLRQFTSRALDHLKYARMFRDFADSLYTIIPCLASGVLGLTDNYNCLYLHTGLADSDALARDIHARLGHQVAALAGDTSPAIPPPVITTSDPDAPIPRPNTHCLLTAPVTGQRNRLEGIVFVALPGSLEANRSEMNALHLASHHLTTLLQAMDEARENSMWDEVTGLHNHTYLEESLPRIWELAERNRHPLGVITIDLDGFTDINTQHGLAIGDRIMKEAADRMVDCIGTADLLVRQKGDTFRLLVTNPEGETLRGLGRRLHRALTETPYPVDRGNITLRATLGGALSGHDSGARTSQQLFDLANQKLQELKLQGGNRVDVWSPQTSAEMHTFRRSPLLLVDDDPQVSKLIHKMMGDETVDITSVLSVDQAEELFQAGKRFHVMLTDISMPERDGFEMLRLAADIDPDMVNLVTSGNISKHTEHLLFDAGCSGIIRKPFKLQDVRNRFSAALQDHARRQRKARSAE